MTHDDSTVRATATLEPMEECPPLPMLRQSFASGRLSGRIEAHVASCPRCRRTLSFLQRRAQAAANRRALVVAPGGKGEPARDTLRRWLGDRIGEVILDATADRWSRDDDPELVHLVLASEADLDLIHDVRERWPRVRPLVSLGDDAPELAVAALGAGAFDVVAGDSFSERRRLGESAQALMDGESAPVEPLFGRILPPCPTSWNWLSDAPPGRPLHAPREALTRSLMARGVGDVELREVQTWALGSRCEGLERAGSPSTCWCAMLPAARDDAGELADRLERLRPSDAAVPPVVYLVPPGFATAQLPAQRTFPVATAVGVASLFWHMFPAQPARREVAP